MVLFDKNDHRLHEDYFGDMVFVIDSDGPRPHDDYADDISDHFGDNGFVVDSDDHRPHNDYADDINRI
ncbi:hypothetical protein CEXT_358021 [Caerostris extrusa]|uniref:Uncharacterized protein n=1 Tax=Caerostris extrusa TaxID=172846 RepID=A0AAV4VDI8_CAEEX|nr:hypothetical protein CEXT_358021 [Caerostris extrusa]